MKPTELKINKIQIQLLSQNLKSLIKKKGLSESDLAKKLDIPLMTVRRIVSGETTDPRISTLKLFADFLGVTVDSLIEETNIQTAVSPQFVPILDWTLASKINSLNDVNLKTWDNWQPIFLGENSSVSKNAFALPSKPSMQPRFPTGTLFIIDSSVQPEDGEIILLKILKSSELSIRELIIDPPKWQLQPVVVGSEVIYYSKDHHKILGTVVLTLLYSRKRNK